MYVYVCIHGRVYILLLISSRVCVYFLYVFMRMHSDKSAPLTPAFDADLMIENVFFLFRFEVQSLECMRAKRHRDLQTDSDKQCTQQRMQM